MNQFLAKDPSGNWNTIPPVPLDQIKNINCHKFVLYLTGKMSWEEMVFDQPIDGEVDFTYGPQAQGISNALFIPVANLESLYQLASEACEIDKPYIGQILDTQTGEMAHSFIIERDGEDNYLCSDKPGFKYPFTVQKLNSLFDFVNKDGEKPYHHQAWRFIPLTI